VARALPSRWHHASLLRFARFDAQSLCVRPTSRDFVLISRFALVLNFIVGRLTSKDVHNIS
jgi:hypothetical protein